jgi:acyl-CoA dehydrogenase
VEPRDTGSDGGLAEQLALGLEPRHAELDARIRAFVAHEVMPREHEESDAFGLDVARKLGAAGLLDAGVDLDVRALCVLRERTAYASGLADSMLALQGLGYGPIALGGSEAQRARWRDPVRRGEVIAAIGITEPEAGSDVAGIQTRATRRADGAWVLSGEKCFITNAGIAGLYTVIARTGEDRAKGLSAFAVPGELVRLVERYDLVAPHPSGAIAFDDVVLPPESLVGREGEGMRLALGTLDRFRTTVGAAALGLAQRALDEAVARATARVQFGKSIASFQQIQAMLADSWAELMAARLLVYRAASAWDRGEASGNKLASAAKLLATETAQRVVDRAVQIHGGLGVRRGTPVERLYREVRALRIYEGTSEIQRVVLSRALLG